MIEIKTHAITLARFKHSEEDKQEIVFISGYPNTHDIFTWPVGKVTSDTREFFSKLAKECKIHIAVSDDQ